MAITAIAQAAEPRRVSIFGSTGSVGCNTVSLLQDRLNDYEVGALTARTNVDLLARQARGLNAKMAVIADASRYGALKEALAGTSIAVAAGETGLAEAAARPVDWAMMAIVGAAGLAPALGAIRQGAAVALANKECLVCAGALMIGEVVKNGATLLPVDSEHNAIFQVFDIDNARHVERIILTASGGPFRTMERGQMATVTPAQAVAHPNWDMGAKISVDSATMMNKGLELIEAFHLFPVREDQIDILVHPQSVVHSMVAYCDGSVLAQLGSPDMRTPIAHTLAWPKRIDVPVARLDLAEIGELTFEKPDFERFPALSLAREALRAGQQAPVVLNAANEVAVHAFLEKKLDFLGIVATVERTLEQIGAATVENLDHVFHIDQEARRVAGELIATR